MTRARNDNCVYVAPLSIVESVFFCSRSREALPESLTGLFCASAHAIVPTASFAFPVSLRTARLKNRSRENSAAWLSVSCLDHETRDEAFAPGPFDLYSANQAVFSRAASRQLSQPSARMCAPSQQSIKTTRAYGRHGLPR